MFVCQSMVEERHMCCESRARDQITVAIEATAHGVEECIGEVACVIGLVSRVLYTIVLRYDLAQVIGGRLQGCLQLLKRISLLHESHVAAHRNGVLHDIADEVPCAWCSVV